MASLSVLVHGEGNAGSLAWYVANAFRGAGHRAQTFDATRHDAHVPRIVRSPYLVPVLRDLAIQRAARRFVTTLRRTRPDLLVVTKGTYLFPGSIRVARELCGGVINLFPDGVSEVHKPGILEALSEYHRVFMKEPYLVDRLRAVGFDNVSYMPQCCDPSVHRPIEMSEDDRCRFGADVSLVGSAYPYRVRLLMSLPLSEFLFRLWGEGWRRTPAPLAQAYAGGEATGVTQAKVFNASRINLNTAHLQDVFGVNKRTFEIAGCGGFQLAPEQRDLPALFEIGREIVTYRDVGDLRDKIRYYLPRHEERSVIAGAAQARAHRDHSYARRIDQILSELGM